MASNPLLDVLSPQQQLPPQRPNNPMELLAEFRKFAQGMTPQGAQQQIRQLLSSGRMTQQQFQQLQAQARQFAQFLGLK